MNYLSAENLSKSFGEQELFSGITFGLAKGDKVALVARNGTGKTTLLRILGAVADADSGEFTFRNGIRVAYLEQAPELDPDKTVGQLIQEGNSQVRSAIQAYESALQASSNDHSPEAARKLEEASSKMDHLHAWDYERRLTQLLDLFRITQLEQAVGKLSGGEKKRLAMAMVLLEEPDFLILDEPTNHLDIEMIEWLEDYLGRSSLTLLMVTHDRYFLDRVCNRIMELSLGILYQYQGNYYDFLEKRSAREELKKVEAHRAGQLMKKELDWLRRMPKARTTKSKSRIDAFDGIKEKAQLEVEGGELVLGVKSPRLGGKIMELESLAKSYGSLSILSPFTYKFSRDDRVGIIGRNGSGKTTFLDLISGLEQADSGKVITGETVKMGYYRQMHPDWDKEMRVIDVVKEIAEVVHLENGRVISASKFLEHFMFAPEAQYKRVALLSGGELRRLHLLTVLIRNPNFLILDEPTNDLDLFALNKLEEFLMEFKGVLILVSHDRYFLDKLSSHLFVFGGDGSLRDYYGSYTAYHNMQLDAARKKEGGAKPERIVEAKPKAVKSKLTYKEKLEYEALEPEIDALEKEKAELENELAIAALDYEKLNKLSSRIAVIIGEIDHKTERWMELDQYS